MSEQPEVNSTIVPKWNFDDATFNRSAASFDNADHLSIVIHNYRWRLGRLLPKPSSTSTAIDR